MAKEKNPNAPSSGPGTAPDLTDLGITVKEEEGGEKKYEWKGQSFNSEGDVVKAVLSSYKNAEKKMHEATSESSELKRRIAELEALEKEEPEENLTGEEEGDILYDKDALAKYITSTIDKRMEAERIGQSKQAMAQAKAEALQQPEIAEHITAIEKLVTTTAMPLLLANNPQLASALGANPYVAAYNLLKRTDGTMLTEAEWKKKEKEVENALTEGGSKGGKTKATGKDIFDIISSEEKEVELK